MKILTAIGVLFAVLAIHTSTTAAGSTTVVVPANVPATDTGIALTAGMTAIVTATGTWDVCGGGCPSGPDGATNGALGSSPGVEGLPAGLLIGSLDGGLTFFAIGSGPAIVTGPGELYLGPNDGGDYGDNSGSLHVRINVHPVP